MGGEHNTLPERRTIVALTGLRDPMQPARAVDHARLALESGSSTQAMASAGPRWARTSAQPVARLLVADRPIAAASRARRARQSQTVHALTRSSTRHKRKAIDAGQVDAMGDRHGRAVMGQCPLLDGLREVKALR